MQKLQSVLCKIHLGSSKAYLRMRRRLRHQIFYVKMFPRKFYWLGQSFMQNYQGVPELFKKTSRWEGVHLPPSPKKQFSCTLNSCSCTHGCFMPLILYLIQNIFQELIISYLTGNKSLEINFPEIALNNTLMTTNSCKSTTIQQNVIVNLLLFTLITLMTSNLRLTCCICRH